MSKEIQQRNYQMTHIFLSIMKIPSNCPDASVTLVQGAIWYEMRHTHTHTLAPRWPSVPQILLEPQKVETSLKHDDGAMAVEENSPQ